MAAHKLIRTQATEWDEIDLNEEPRRRICKLANVNLESTDEDVREFYDSLLMFGPFYKGNENLMSNLKEAAWEHIVNTSRTPESETNETYLSHMRRIERLARNAYDAEEDDHDQRTLDDMRKTAKFQWMMIKDGCLILQLALFVLGGSTLLGHPPDHLVFGQLRNVTARVKKWTKSIFFVGNQIPLVVLKELMKQSFFQDVISKGDWKRPPDLFRRTLYDLLVLPELETMNRRSSCQTMWQFLYRKTGLVREDRSVLLLKQKPSDLLHGLHLLVMGPTTSDSSVAKYEYYAHPEDLDLEIGAGSNTIRGATELRQAGIHFRNAKGAGLLGIKFTTNVFRAVLSLPSFTVDDDTELVFRYLKKYEITQPLGINNREVSSYIQFMSELIRTPDDANLLWHHGIIRASRHQREKLPGILNKLAAGDTNQNLRIIRLEIDEYSRPPWGRLRNFLSLVLLLTVVQTIYTILGYYKK